VWNYCVAGTYLLDHLCHTWAGGDHTSGNASETHSLSLAH